MTNFPAPQTALTTMVPTRWRSTSGLRTALTWLLAADAAAAIALVVTHLHRASVIGGFQNGSVSFADLRGSDDPVGAASGVYSVLFLATATVWIIWQWRSAKNNEMLGRISPRFTAGWSIGAWFIPFANLVIPVRIVQDLWQGSDRETRNLRDWRGLVRWPVIGWWWTFYLLGTVLRLAVSGNATLDQIKQGDRTTSVGCALMAVAAGFAIVVVRTVTARQEAAVADRVSTTPPAAGWYADPSTRFEHRYWDGVSWTEHVATAGQTATDRVGEAR
jgi:hypothetical protein